MKTVSNSLPIARGRIMLRKTATRAELQKCFDLPFSVHVQTRLEFVNMFFDVTATRRNAKNEIHKREKVKKEGEIVREILLRSKTILLEKHIKIMLVHILLHMQHEIYMSK